MSAPGIAAPRVEHISEASLQRDLTADARERAARAAGDWIKALRLLSVEGRPLRDRFTYRGDSLWWFAELYLHKQGVIERLFRVALALEAFYARTRPSVLIVRKGDAVLECLAPQLAWRLGLPCHIGILSGAAPLVHFAGDPAASSRLALDLKSRFYTWSALASRLRFGRGGRHGGTGGTLAFVHSAFWRKPTNPDGGGADEGQEGYIGAVLQALSARAAASGAAQPTGSARAAPEARAAAAAATAAADPGRALDASAWARPVRLVGVGPRTNFKARRWWHAIAPSRAGAGEIPVEPIERFANWGALAGSRAIWRDRFSMEQVLLASEAIRAHASVLGYDMWPIVAEELRGVARLQFPWSARAMDEAAAAMEAMRPDLIVTYAEAGGWGRALMLEARRRGIPSVGLQHGFIYRHWLNYRHEPDEMLPSPNNAADRGFPRPDLTLVYDGYAARYLTTAGSFPAEAVRVTGSPALDALAAAVAQVDETERTRIRGQLGARSSDHLIVLVTKFTQVADALGSLLQAVSTLRDVRLIIKPHPAETADPYRAAAAAAATPAATAAADTTADAGARAGAGAGTGAGAGAGAGTPNVLIAPPALDLARLLSVARLVVTVNSTVAIDAIALGLPSLIVGLPNNLTPFVDAGVMAGMTSGVMPGGTPGMTPGGTDTSGLAALISALIHDQAYRDALLTRARAFAAQHAMQPDGHAAERAVDAMLGLAQARPV